MALVVLGALCAFVVVFVVIYSLVEWAVYLSERRTYRTTMGKR